MSRPTAFGAVCEHGRRARKCVRCADAETIADLRDRLRIMAPMVCEGCGCARAVFAHMLCVDCEEALRAAIALPVSAKRVACMTLPASQLAAVGAGA